MLVSLTVCASFAPPPRRARRADHPRCSTQNLYDERLPDWLTARAAALGFAAPTAIQAAAHPTLLDGADAIIEAETGSGKTLAYVLPLLAALRPQATVQALVLLPTRELAAQVTRVARRLAAGSPERLHVMALLDGSGAKRQRRWLLAQPPQVVVGNVEQVDSVIRARRLPTANLRLLVVDEVDACLAETRTRALLQDLLSGALRADDGGALKRGVGRQTLFVSATIPQRQHFAKSCAQRHWCREAPRLLSAADGASGLDSALPSQLRHGVAVCTDAKRLAALRVLLKRHRPAAAIVFVKGARPLARIAESLAGVVEEAAPPVLSDDAPLRARADAVRALRDGESRLLLSTPLGARGLDIPECSHVYLFDLPDSAEAYAHAAGRCGRMGRPGTVSLLCNANEGFVVDRIGNALGIEFEDAAEEAYG